MDPQLLFRPMATVEADLAARRQSGSGSAATGASVDPLNPSAPSTAAPGAGFASNAGIGAEPGLPAVGASGLGLASSGGGGGLASSPNVPAPGTSINPETGLPHTAGLTRQELAAMKAQQEHGRRLSEMSGRQQAAAQLVGSGPVIGGAGQPGSPTSGEKSIIEDVTRRMSTLGHKTYEALPPAIKDVFAEPKGKGPEGSPVKPRRGSAAAMFENVKNTASRLSHDLQQTVSNAIAEPEGYHPSQPGIGAGVRRPSAAVATSPDTRRESQTKSTEKPATNVGSEPSVFQQVKGFLSEAFEAPPAGGYPNPTTNRTLPSEENQGARPGEVSAGAGALPGKAGEAGVAVPPDVRAQEGTDGGHITTSSAPAASTIFNGPPIVLPPVSAVDAGAFGAAFLPSQTQTQTQRGGPPHSNVPISEKTKVEEVVENLADRAKGFFGFGTAWDEKDGDKDKAKLNELRRESASGKSGDPIADGAVGAAFGRGTLGNTTAGTDPTAFAGATAPSLDAGNSNSANTKTTGLSDLAPPIPASQTGVIDDKGTHLTPSSAPAGVKPDHSSSSGIAAAGAGAGLGGLAALAGANAFNKSNDAGASANASGRSTPVPRAGALGAGTSDAVLTPSEAAVAAQASNYMDAGAKDGATSASATAPDAKSGLGAAGTGSGAAAGALAGGAAGAALSSGNDKDLDSANKPARPLESIPPNERLDSLASFTAIRHGKPGDLHNGHSAPSSGAAGIGSSPLATVDSTDAVDRTHRPDDSLASTAAASAALGAGASAAGAAGASGGSETGQKSTVRGTGPSHTTSLTPGGEEGSIGHPPTVAGESGEAKRTPGTYPAAQHEDAVNAAIKEAREEGRDISGKEHAAAGNHKVDGVAGVTGDKDKATPSAVNGASATSTATPEKTGRTSTSADRVGAASASPASAIGHGNGNGKGDSSGHRRASSSASTDSKKVGFMKKLKGEMKVISGKLGNNEEKVLLGEKIKHGEA